MTTTDDLTDRQRECLALIVCYIRANNGMGPTVRELMPPMGAGSPNAVVCHLRALERKGYVRRQETTARGIEVVGLVVRVECADSVAGERLRKALEVT